MCIRDRSCNTSGGIIAPEAERSRRGSSEVYAVVDMGAYEYQPTNPGDFDDDGDVDLDDYSTLATCMTGPNGGVPSDCHPADLDQDDDVDLQDMARFEIAFAGR